MTNTDKIIFLAGILFISTATSAILISEMIYTGVLQVNLFSQYIMAIVSVVTGCIFAIAWFKLYPSGSWENHEQSHNENGK